MKKFNQLLVLYSFIISFVALFFIEQKLNESSSTKQEMHYLDTVFIKKGFYKGCVGTIDNDKMNVYSGIFYCFGESKQLPHLLLFSLDEANDRLVIIHGR